MHKNLIVVGFDGEHRAAEVLSQLQQLAYDWTLDLQDAVAVYRTDDGRLRVDQSVKPTTKEGAGYGALIGGLLGAVLMVPFTGGLSAAAAAAAVSAGALGAGTFGGAMGAADAETWKQTYGISDDFIKEVSGMVLPRDSALFAIVHGAEPELIAEHFRGYCGTILKTSLSPRVAERVQQTLQA